MDDPQDRHGSGAGSPTAQGTRPPSGAPSADDPKQAAKQQGEKLAGDAREHVEEVAVTAKESTLEVIDEVTHHASDLAADARQQLHQQARQQTDHLGETIKTFGDKLHALADGNPDEAGHVGDYANQLADQVEQIGRRVADLGFDGTVDELQRFARRRPGMFLLGAATAGFAVSRLGRGMKDAQQDGPSREADRVRTPAMGSRGQTPASPTSGPARSSDVLGPMGGPTQPMSWAPGTGVPMPPPPNRPDIDPSRGQGRL